MDSFHPFFYGNREVKAATGQSDLNALWHIRATTAMREINFQPFVTAFKINILEQASLFKYNIM